MEEITPKPRRFWRPRFGLRSLFVLVTVVSIATAWVAYSLNWIRGRREFLATPHPVYGPVQYEFSNPLASGRVIELPYGDDRERPGPSGLWVFGERARCGIIYHPSVDPQDIERARRLFPEAVIIEWK